MEQFPGPKNRMHTISGLGFFGLSASVPRPRDRLSVTGSAPCAAGCSRRGAREIKMGLGVSCYSLLISGGTLFIFLLERDYILILYKVIL